MPKKPPILPLTEDLPYIKCDVCQKAAKSLFKAVRRKRDEVKPLKLGEEKILEIVEKSCNPDEEVYGEWINKLDILEGKDGLKLQEHTKVGKCREECKTIARSCDESIGDVDTDLGELLWKNDLKLASFINEVCYSLTSACNKLKKKFIKGKRKDFKFVEMTEKDIEAMKMMRNMKGQPGMPGLEMYTPEDLENMREQLGIDPATESNLPSGKQEGDTPQEFHHTAPIGFVDTIKAAGSDIIQKVKSFFGYSTSKSEL